MYQYYLKPLILEFVFESPSSAPHRCSFRSAATIGDTSMTVQLVVGFDQFASALLLSRFCDVRDSGLNFILSCLLILLRDSQECSFLKVQGIPYLKGPISNIFCQILSVAIMELLLFLVVCWMIMRRSHRECSGDMEKREDDDVLLEIFFRKQGATPI